MVASPPPNILEWQFKYIFPSETPEFLSKMKYDYVNMVTPPHIITKIKLTVRILDSQNVHYGIPVIGSSWQNLLVELSSKPGVIIIRLL